MVDENPNTLDLGSVSTPIIINKAYSDNLISSPYSGSNYGYFSDTYSQFPNSNRVLNSDCSLLKKEADVLNQEFKRIIEDLDDKISSLPKDSNSFLSNKKADLENDLRSNDSSHNKGNNITSYTQVIQTDNKSITNENNASEDIYTLKDQLNMKEKASVLFERDMAKMQQNMPIKPKDWYKNYNIESSYYRRRMHPTSISNLGRVSKDDDYIRTARRYVLQTDTTCGLQNKAESSFSDSEAIPPSRIQLSSQRKSLRDLAESWSKVSTSFDDSANEHSSNEETNNRTCKAHICGKSGCRYHKNCVLQIHSMQSLPKTNTAAPDANMARLLSRGNTVKCSPNMANDNVVTASVANANAKPTHLVFNAQIIKGKQKRSFGRNCAC